MLTVVLGSSPGLILPVCATPFNWTGAAIPGPDGIFNVVGNWDLIPVPAGLTWQYTTLTT